MFYTRAWTIILILFSLIYVGGYIGMTMAGETSITEKYYWFFLVTVSSVGYGDLYPTTSVGRIVSVFIIVFGLGALSILIAKMIEFFINVVDKFSKGYGRVRFSGHTVIIGYRQGGTEKVIKEIHFNNKEEQIVLCDEDQEVNPCAQDNVSFIRGELASDDVHRRSNIKSAGKIIIIGKDDNETFFTAYSAREINKSAHLVCYLNNEDHKQKIKKLPKDQDSLNQVILPVNMYLMAQELQDPESSGVFQHLVSNLNGATLYRVDIPSDVSKTWDFETVFLNFKKQYDATVVAIKAQELISNPAMNENIAADMALFYISKNRLNKINWQEI